MPHPYLSPERLRTLLGALDSTRPTYQGLADAIRLLVVDGRVPAGTRLPSERDLSHALSLSRTTVAAAYAQVRDRGYAVARQGSGTVTVLPQDVRRGTGAALFPAEVPDGVIDLTCAAMRAPVGTSEAYEGAVADLCGYLAGAGYVTLGVPDLRDAIAERYAARGLPTRAEDILVTSGAVSGVAVVARALVRPGDRVLVETPTYPNTVANLRAGNARLTAVPVDADGWDLVGAASTIAAVRPVAALLIPDFHNPTGALLPDAGREVLATALSRAGTTAIVDETVAELRLDELARPLPFAAFHPEAFLVGSASKSLWGGLRVGWVRAPRGRMPALLAARATLDIGAPVLEQLVTLRLLRTAVDGVAVGRLADLRAARDAAMTALAAQLPDVRFGRPAGGMSLWLEVGRSAARVVEAAEEAGLLVAGGSRFAVDAGYDQFLRLPYVLDPTTMTEAVSRLATAYARVGSQGRDHARRGRRWGPLVA